ncbi:hypothetical protein BJ138DRAFT_1096943 [Hygrophoropsis aurantiaca]|uniref:Uncharacterized protein n=1 Tax=Hygrophoropsis aurantiaca TaxID=72124 RepID=A0ACB8AV37_9AGAM|nr:hypothetical protein BJ138DRAFT_1096943 [Hygrophoropsis aurantiaca]
MFTPYQASIPSEAELASKALADEGKYRFSSFSASDAVTLGLSIRKRFRGSSRHAKGKGIVISIQTIAGHTLFACTVGDLGGGSGIADVSLDSWTCVESMINVVKRTGHSSYYVEKGMVMGGKTAKQLGNQAEIGVIGGAFPIWLENAHCCPIAVVACYSGSSHDDHHLVETTIRDYLYKQGKNVVNTKPSSESNFGTEMPLPSIPYNQRESTLVYAERRESIASTEWMQEHAQRPHSPYASS